VRSDTNVEDLPGFTGAGLNLTLPHVVGFENVVKAISEVWASPYTARAFAWRQGHMKDPEHVYPAVLLLRTVPAEKSGVMVTVGIETGDTLSLSIAVNEGTGGAVEGQAAESLRVDTRDGKVVALATATAPWRYAPRAEGGVARLRTSGSERLLLPDEITQLIAFAKDLPARFPALVDDAGRPAPADVEFAFVGGQLQLLQIRPFLESRKAQATTYLVRMDDGLRAARDKVVRLREVPQP
jgi:phosphoenolpyruvate synthase/pyruvate phosphate dikinase